MKLYIKQRVFSWRDKFTVKDESGVDRWFAQGELFSWGRKLHIYDSYGREAAFIRQKLLSMLRRYYIEINGYVYTMRKELTLLRPKYSIEGLPWQMSGDFWAHEYELHDGRIPIMRMSKCWFTWGDSYELNIYDPANELICLCIALTIDCMQADADAAAHSAALHHHHHHHHRRHHRR